MKKLLIFMMICVCVVLAARLLIRDYNHAQAQTLVIDFALPEYVAAIDSIAINFSSLADTNAGEVYFTGVTLYGEMAK